MLHQLPSLRARAGGWATRHKNDDARMLLDHVTRCGTSCDKARPDHCVERHHELVDRQVHSELSVSILFGERAGCIENNVDLTRLLQDAIDILVDSHVIESVNGSRVCPAAVSRD